MSQVCSQGDSEPILQKAAEIQLAKENLYFQSEEQRILTVHHTLLIEPLAQSMNKSVPLKEFS